MGEWWQTETDSRAMVDAGCNFQIFAGTVFLEDRPVQKIGKRAKNSYKSNIGVPHGFFKIVIDVDRQQAVGFFYDRTSSG